MVEKQLTVGFIFYLNKAYAFILKNVFLFEIVCL